MSAYRGVKDLQRKRTSEEEGLSGSASTSDLATKMSKLKALSDADKELMETLQKKIEEQRRELEKRTITITTLQRNFENLSSIAAAERNELAGARQRALHHTRGHVLTHPSPLPLPSGAYPCPRRVRSQRSVRAGRTREPSASGFRPRSRSLRRP